jgi:hypothetical protein
MELVPTSYVFRQDRKYFHLNVPNRFENNGFVLPVYRNLQERNVLPVFKNKKDAERFERDVLSRSCGVWTVETTYPVDERMDHMSVMSKLRGKTMVSAENSLMTTFDLHDPDTIVSLSVRAHYGFLVVGSFHTVSNVVSLNGIVVTPNLEHVSEREHLKTLCDLFEESYLKN